MHHRRALTGMLLTLILSASLVGCLAVEPAGSAGETRRELVVGLLPDEAAERQREKYAPLVAAIHAETGFDVRLQLTRDYADLLGRFAAGAVDLAYFGGYTFILAKGRHGAVPLAMRDIDAKFVSLVLVGAHSQAQTLSDLAGASFGFGSPLSTSGHIMPRYFFDRLGIRTDSFFSQVVYSGSHDSTIQAVASGHVEAGVANGQIVQQWLARSGARRAAVRVLWQSPPYVDYVWAVQSSMTRQTRAALLRAFLSLSLDDPDARAFLDDIGARYFVPAGIRDFDALIDAVSGLPAELRAAAESEPG